MICASDQLVRLAWWLAPHCIPIFLHILCSLCLFVIPILMLEPPAQGKAEALGDVVRALKATFDLQHVYVWHGLSAYWSGVSVDDVGVSQYNARLVFAEPTPGLKEIEPSMAWNPSVVSGVGVPQSAAQLYNDMHEYLSSSGQPRVSCCHCICLMHSRNAACVRVRSLLLLTSGPFLGCGDLCR